MKGRPLFPIELSKEVPAPDTYDIKRNGSIEAVRETAHLATHNFKSKRNPMELGRKESIYYETEGKLACNPSMTLPTVDLIKRKNPCYSIGKAA
jgi:hypothetical protein